MYNISVHPGEEYISDQQTSNPRHAVIVVVVAIIAVSLLFFSYDFFVRREVDSKVRLLDSKRQFVRYVSHEVRTPLNSVCMGLELIQEEIASCLGYRNPEALRNVRDQQGSSSIVNKEAAMKPQDDKNSMEWFNLAEEVLGNALSAVNVLNDLLNYDKIESGTHNLELTELSLREIIMKTTSEFKLPLLKKSIKFNVHYDIESGKGDKKVDYLLAVGDEMRLTQVLRNLLSNALKFTPENGSLTVRIRRDASPVAQDSLEYTLKTGVVKTYINAGRVVISVEDSGVGMSESQVKAVFGAGVQFNVNELQAGGGSGLGLSIAKAIAEQHGGSLECSSGGIGCGTTFTLALNTIVSDDQNDTQLLFDDKDSECGDQLPSLCILVVDDVGSNRRLLGRMLRNRGHTVEEANDGQVAVSMVEEDPSRYDLILMDHQMPTMSGPDAAHAIKQIGGVTAKIVGVTGNLLPEDIHHFEERGADFVLPKPLKIDQLEGLLRNFGLGTRTEP